MHEDTGLLIRKAQAHAPEREQEGKMRVRLVTVLWVPQDGRVEESEKGGNDCPHRFFQQMTILEMGHAPQSLRQDLHVYLLFITFYLCSLRKTFRHWILSISQTHTERHRLPCNTSYNII